MSVHDDQFLYPAWGISLGVHFVVIVFAVIFTARVQPVLQENVFKWDVALVEAEKIQPISQQEEHVGKPSVRSKTRALPTSPPVEPASEAVLHRVAPRQTVQMAHPVIEPVKPFEQDVEPLQPSGALVEQQGQKSLPKVETLEHVVEAAQSKSEPLVETQESDGGQHAQAPVHESRAAGPEPLEARPAHDEPTAQASAASPLPAPAQAAESVSPPFIVPASPIGSDEPVPTAKAAQGSGAPADHRWLAESLWRRVAELKRYPNSARLNGQEGKVILKAVIRSDGQLAQISVQKSSGHAILDAAAIEAVKLACPLYMKHAINKPEIVVSLPIVYSLAN